MKFALQLFLSFTLIFPGVSQELPETSSHQKMVQALQIIEESAWKLPFVGDARITEIEQYIKANETSLSEEPFFNLLLELAQAQTGQGHIAAAIDNLNIASRVAQSVPGSESGIALAKIELAKVFLRKAETENCCSRYTPDSCILPLREGALHTREESSRKAIALFEEGMALGKKDKRYRDTTYYQALWLLNLAYMTIGEYPETVPEHYRIPPEMLNPEADFPRFENIAAKLGVARNSLAGGVVADDFDGDHDIDLAVTSWEPGGTMAIYENLGERGFRDRTSEAGLEGITGGINMVQADYDNDGDVDIFIPRGGWMGALGKQPNSLLQNDGSGAFRDVAFEAGLAEVWLPTQTAAWGDFDLDGHLDLYVGNEQNSITAPCQLFRNQGDGTFVDVAKEAGVRNNLFTKGVIWTDVNNDRFPDLVVSNLNGPNRLYLNLGNGTFEDRAESAGIRQPEISFPLWSWDVNNDGNRDLFINSYTGKTHVQAMRTLGLESPAAPAALYRGDGTGHFQDVSSEFGIDIPTLTMGCNIGDLNNDGFTDCYLGTGDPTLMSIVPNRLYLNEQGKRLVDVTMASGLGHLQKGHGVAFADFDQDGDLDIFEQLGGAITIDTYRDAYFQNPGFSGKWIQLKAVGVHSNRSALGVRIRVKVETSEGPREIHREINTGGSFGSNPLLQHIGLGDALKIIEMELDWPASGTKQRFTDVPLQTLLLVEEDKLNLESIAPGFWKW